MNSNLPSIAIQAAIEAGRDIMAIYDDPAADFGIERKADNSPLTRADKAAHARIMSFLEPTGIPVLSEEGAHLPYEERRHWHRLWIVDPLDGTKEFIKRNGEFTVNIALVEDGTPILGVIYVPVKQELYYGSAEQASPLTVPPSIKVIAPSLTGDWGRRGDTECVSGPTKGSKSPLATEGRAGGESVGGGSARPFTVVASRSHLSPETEAFINELRREHPDLELVSSGSSLKICLVAEGKADIYPRHAPTMEWDTAAGHAIALAAGREMIDATTGAPLTYNKPDLHNPWFIVR